MALIETISPQTCKRCGVGYQQKKYLLLEAAIALDDGLCPPCLALAREEDAIADLREQERERAAVRQLWRQECGIGPKFSTARFDTYEIAWAGKAANNFSESRSRCIAYAQGFPIDYRQHLQAGGEAYRSMILCSPGTQGVGKTHLVNAVCHAIIDRWNGEVGTCPVKILSEAQLYHRIEETYSDNTPGALKEADIIKQLSWVPLLVIDDVGTETRTKKDFSNRILFAIVNGRYENNRPVVMTTNLSTEELSRYLSDNDGRVRIMDRLLEMANGSIFVIRGPSHRGHR